MDHEEFRRHAEAFTAWMADYLENISDYPVRAQVSPGEISQKISASPPVSGEDMADIFADFQRDIVPGITHWQHPRFFAYFPANSSPPSLLAEMLTAAIGAQCMLWQTSPAATELETRVMDWLRQMIGLDDGFHGCIQDSASSATLCALLTAREKQTDWQSNEVGLASLPPMTVYCSEETHSSIEKNVKIIGLGRRQVRKIATNDRFLLDAVALDAAINKDKADGFLPLAVVASIGTTGIGASDSLQDLGPVCKRHNVWLHVDAAWAGSALILDEYRHLLAGMADIDSFVFNPHKWLFTNFDCSAYFVRDADALVRTFHIMPEYLKTAVTDSIIDYRDWGVPLGRRFRALKLWFVIRSYGISGLKKKIATHISYAERLAALIDDDPNFEMMAPRAFALICFRFRPESLTAEEDLEAVNADLVQKLNNGGKIYLTQNRVRGTYAIRISIGQTTTTWDDVEAAWEEIKTVSAECLENRKS